MNYTADEDLEPHDMEACEQAEGEGSSEATHHDESALTFPGDRGELPLDTRRAIVQLLLGPAIDGRRQTKLWPVLLRDETVVRARLHELFLDLVIDHEQRVAFTRQVVADDIDAPILLRKATLTFFESVLLLFLRQRLTQADTRGERAVVSRQEMLEHLAVFEREQNVDRARFEKHMHNAIEKAKKLNLIQKLRGAEDRFEVSPTLKLLFPAEEIQALTRTYENLSLEGPHGSVESPPESDSIGQSPHEIDDEEPAQ